MNSYFIAPSYVADAENQNPYLRDMRVCRDCGLSVWERPAATGALICPGYFNTAPPLDVLFIGMSPGADEDRLGRPFVGRAGKLLFHLFDKVFVPRIETYDDLCDRGKKYASIPTWGVTNIVRCHTPENRPPKIMEVAACREWLEAEVEAASPKVIFLLGNSAIPLAFDKAKIGQVHGQARVVTIGRHCAQAVAIACYHPAAALRNNNLVPEIIDAMKLGKELLD